MALNIFSEQARYFSHYLSEPFMTVCLLLFLRWKFPLHVEDTCMFPLLLPKKNTRKQLPFQNTLLVAVERTHSWQLQSENVHQEHIAEETTMVKNI